eukprot:244572-Lingulodinium_polyedra.AAC.1
MAAGADFELSLVVPERPLGQAVAVGASRHVVASAAAALLRAVVGGATAPLAAVGPEAQLRLR